MKTEDNFPLIRVAIVDDHKILLEGLEHIINHSNIAQVIDKAYSIAGCREMLLRCQPEVLMLDVSLSDGNGIDLCSEIRKKYPDMNILMLTSYAESAVVTRALDEGALGYVLKNSMSEEIIDGIYAVASGKRFLCDQAEVLLKKKSKKQIPLSPRECEILKLIVEGYTIKEISDKLFLGFETIRSYCKYLHLKLDVHNTASLVRKAIEQKLV
jgi:Response regulator containing a CheY-like receiver domain and an HTH DNA-binding domain